MKSRRKKKNQALECEDNSSIRTTLKYNTSSIQNMYTFLRKSSSQENQLKIQISVHAVERTKNKSD